MGTPCSDAIVRRKVDVQSGPKREYTHRGITPVEAALPATVRALPTPADTRRWQGQQPEAVRAMVSGAWAHDSQHPPVLQTAGVAALWVVGNRGHGRRRAEMCRPIGRRERRATLRHVAAAAGQGKRHGCSRQ